MKKVDAYKCDYCTKWLKSRSGMARHERKCLWNPEHKACASCGNNHEYENEQESSEYDEVRQEQYVAVCSHKSRWCDHYEFDLFAEKGNLKKNCPFWKKTFTS